MTTCQILDKPTMSGVNKSFNIVQTPPGAKTWLAPRGKISTDKIENWRNS